MGLFERFPYTNFHELNAAWIIEELTKLKTTIEQFVSINALKYADPIQWSIIRQYEKNTIVIDPLTGTAYISVQPVPAGVAITNTDYWTVVFDLGSFVVRAAKNFTDKWEDETTLTATFPSSVNDWIIWGDTLYRVLSPIVAGDQYVIGSNIEHFTIENVTGHIQDLDTTDKSNLVAAINELVQALIDEATRVNDITGSLDDLNTTDQSNLVAAINEVLQTIIDTAGNLDSLNTSDKSNLVAAINELLSNIGDLTLLNTTDKSSAVNAINEVVDDISNMDARKLNFVMGDISITRYDYGDYVIDVLKLSHKNQDDSDNQPFCKGEYNLEGMEIFSEGTKLCVNAGFYDSAYKMQGNTISNGSVITGNPISSPAVCYLGIKDADGDLAYYDQTTPMADILADGCSNAALAWCPLIENHALSPNILNISQTSQQNIGVDDDLNYYIVTTSYYCPLDIPSVAAWILSNYPEIKTAFAIDSGGSAQTRVYNIMTNANSDLNRQYGRKIPSAICFPIGNEKNDITSVLDVMRISKENTMPMVIYNSGSHTQIGTKVQMSFFNSYQVGNIFFGCGVVELEDGYDGSWVRLTTLENYLPSPDRHSYFPLICHYSVTNNGRMDINPSSDEMNIKPTIEIKGPANSSGSSRLYDVNIIYAVKQMR